MAGRIRRLTSAPSRCTFDGWTPTISSSPCRRSRMVPPNQRDRWRHRRQSPVPVPHRHQRWWYLPSTMTSCVVAPRRHRRRCRGFPGHRFRRVAGTALEQARHGRPTGDHRAVPAPGRNGVSAGRAGGADSAPPFINLQVARSRTRFGTGHWSSADWVNYVVKAAPQTRQYRAPAWPSGTLTGS